MRASATGPACEGLRDRPYAICDVRAVSRLSIRSAQAASVAMLSRRAPRRMSVRTDKPSNGRAAIRDRPHNATATALQCELKNGNALGSGRQ